MVNEGITGELLPAFHPMIGNDSHTSEKTSFYQAS